MDDKMITRIEELGIVPVVKLSRADDAVPLAKALIAGGLPVAEVTFRTAAAEESIRRMAEAFPEMLVGAGTVLSIEQVERAIGAGAKFIVTPGFNPRVVSYCVEHDIPIFPGCPTTSDIEQALELGLKVVKFFPAEQMGGLATIKAVSAPYGQMRFMPTGGVNEKNLCQYLACDKIVACGGSWMVKPELIEAGDFARIEELTRSAVNLMLGFEIRHIGIHGTNADEGLATAKRFSLLFGWPLNPGSGACFVGNCVESLYSRGRGTNGHIAVATNNVARAMAHLRDLGVEFAEDSISMKDGKPTVAYLKEEIGGFAVHLIQK
ncbi:MAG: bifunctional 4-hydroxy-2-oxoglutarate aldolase/2-dehydro-3-deoxy-phosphogluconate aldolase [Clostridiales bacterium]|jgi:2-dehydro-3-deoxyphosphogluconate aldolase / (4S)-4-hydroxy-2-oxoglutarate aldolase|nr:bifunctional 4-hydroxy-2-oxoglutarate aldolase/2-dehydro-3-deoxy-phosphogluconate aldolase [Clostridiales bacterium]MDY4200629.1 bifunctional 4-hydroxy-2-oxoglutarate aldolase/2-dehydro-3-deoxy-phosphogluconate aldolase [Candidatus Fimadaptatus sp.]